MAALDVPGWWVHGFVQLGRHSRALGVVCKSFDLFCRVGLGNWCLEGCGVLAPLPPKHFGGKGLVAAAHRVVMDTLCVQLGLIHGLTLLSRHHNPSLSIVDEFKSG